MSEHRAISRRPQSPPRRQRACLPCTKAKTRCQYENNEIGDGCNRCRRLAISCTPQTNPSIRRPRQVKAKDAFTTIPKPLGQPRHEFTISYYSPPETEQDAGGMTGLDMEADSGRDLRQSPYSIPRQPMVLSPESSVSSDHLFGPGFGITWDQADKALLDFTLIFTAHFPFIILDHDITARRLFDEKPLLLRTILMISIGITSAKSREIRRSVDAWIGQHLLAMEEQSLDILQGLIVHIAWANPHFYSDHRVTKLIYLAVGLAHSLGITKQPAPEAVQARSETQANDEHRAFLACYYIASTNSFQFGRPSPFSPSHVQYCIDALERSSEFSTDFLLIKFIKFQQFLGQIPTFYDDVYDMKGCQEISEHASDRLKDIRGELDDSMSDIAHKHPKFLLLWSMHHYSFTQLHLPMTYATPDSKAASRVQLECLKYCLEATRTYVNFTKSFSPDGFLYTPFTAVAVITFMLISASRLVLVEIDGWDLDEARRSINLGSAIDEMLAKLTAAGKVKAARVAAEAAANPSGYTPDGPDDEEKDKLQVLIRMIESIRDWLDRHGAFGSTRDYTTNPDLSESRTSRDIYLSPQSPVWNFTYFFESLLQVDRDPTL
ncbi:hypothetical protein F5Y14DRAFT_436988 [Nemania sp. NC0429]|nr:hypothetical protein F5Y14DRAFT_436988 [Nemania sp. NC0429]